TESPCHFSPGRASSHNDKVERAFLDERGIAVRGFQDGKDSGSQYLGIAKRIERIAGLLRARRSEEVRPRTGCQNQKIPVVLRAFAGDYGSGMEIDGNDFRHLHIDIRMIPKTISQIRCDIAWRQHSRSYLVKQRLELLIVVLIDERDTQIFRTSQLARTTQPCKTTANNDNVLQVIRLLGMQVLTAGRSLHRCAPELNLPPRLSAPGPESSASLPI